MTRISIIGTVGVPACYGGFESLVDNLLDFTPPGVEYTVFCSALKYPEKLDVYKGARLVYLDRDANGASSVLYDFDSMRRSISMRADVMLVLGVSGCIFLPYIRKKFKGKIVTNIDGLEWKRDKWNAAVKQILRKSEAMAVKYSDVVVCDNKAIQDYVSRSYGKQSELIAYGGNHAAPVRDDALYEKYPFCKKPYAVTVCRIEPENNIRPILEAFSRAPASRLVIAGNWTRSDWGASLKKEFSRFPNILALDPVYEPHEVNWLRSNARVYVHGHSAGGTNPSLVEAMSLGLPVLAYDCDYNRATTQNRALYWSDSVALLQLLQTPRAFSKTASEMLAVAKAEYTWERVAAQYNAVLGGV